MSGTELPGQPILSICTKKAKEEESEGGGSWNEGFERGLSAGADADAQSTKLIDDCSIFLGRSWSGRARHAAFVPPEASIVNLGGSCSRFGSSPAGLYRSLHQTLPPCTQPGQSPSRMVNPPVPFLHHRIFHICIIFLQTSAPRPTIVLIPQSTYPRLRISSCESIQFPFSSTLSLHSCARLEHLAYSG